MASVPGILLDPNLQGMLTDYKKRVKADRIAMAMLYILTIIAIICAS